MTELFIFSPFKLHREAWRALLMNQPGIQVSTEYEEVAQIIPPYVSSPVTILVDLPSPDPRIVQELREKVPHIGLLILVQSFDLAEVIAFLRAGATGLISRQETTGNLARAIIAVGRGEIVLPPEVAVQSLMALAQGQFVGENLTKNLSIDNMLGGKGSGSFSPAEPLTEREIEVLKLLAQGLTNKDIAQSLVLSVRTIEAHLRNIFNKLDVRSRTEAVLWAVRNGYGVQGKP